MIIKQVSIFLENKKGRLAEVTRLLSDEKINIRALSLADTTDFGVLRLIVSHAEKCFQILKENEFVAQMTDVIAVEIDDRPGGLNAAMEALDEGGINIEYMYAFVEKKTDKAIVIFRIDKIQAAVETLQKNQISVLTSDVIESL